MNSSIELNHISVKFRKYHNAVPSLKEKVVNFFAQRKFSEYSDFFALDDINIKLSAGEKIGVIGLNGAGKSTLLKVISGIYPPASGEVKIIGSITPLMDLGAGFNPDQTGRENIYINGSLLGHSNKEIAKHEKKIIAFSELEDFIDTPVKYYSSGMYIRLAFSIATVIDPQILLLDEILAAGDVKFIDKAFDRIHQMIDVSQIVVIVSHSLEQVKKLSNRVIVINRGKIVADGSPDSSISYYLEMIAKKSYPEKT